MMLVLMTIDAKTTLRDFHGKSMILYERSMTILAWIHHVYLWIWMQTIYLKPNTKTFRKEGNKIQS